MNDFRTKLPPLGFFVNPYAIFVKENYKSVDKGDVMSTGKLLSQQWSKLGDAEKKVRDFVYFSRNYPKLKLSPFI